MLRVLKSVAVVLKKMLLLPLKQECPYLLWSDRDAWLSHRNPPDLVYVCFCPCISWKKSLWPFGEPLRWPSSCCPLCSPVLWHCPGFLMPWIPAHFQGPQIELLAWISFFQLGSRSLLQTTQALVIIQLSSNSWFQLLLATLTSSFNSLFLPNRSSCLHAVPQQATLQPRGISLCWKALEPITSSLQE